MVIILLGRTIIILSTIILLSTITYWLSQHSTITQGGSPPQTEEHEYRRPQQIYIFINTELKSERKIRAKVRGGANGVTPRGAILCSVILCGVTLTNNSVPPRRRYLFSQPKYRQKADDSNESFIDPNKSSNKYPKWLPSDPIYNKYD